MMLQRLREDLIWSEPSSKDGSVVVKCPRRDGYYRFGPAEALILKCLDGVTPVCKIKAEFDTRFGDPIDIDEIEDFIASLEAKGLIETSEIETAGTTARSRVRGNLLYLRFKTIDPDWHLSCLSRRLRFCFTPIFVYASSVVIALAFLIFLSNIDELARDVSTLFTLNTLIAAWFIVIGTTIIHEYAHGLTCKHFGGQVREMGVMLIFFQPALYCNVSDAWLFPEKYKRIWVTAAGGFIDLLIWALAILAWRAFAPETVVHYVALVIAATATLRAFFNLNPLIKLDGYYLLSDWLELPNLRQRAASYLKSRFLLDRAKSRLAKAQYSKRERRTYVIYGLLAFVFSIWLLSFIVGRIGGFLVGHLQGIGFLIFMGLLAVGLWPLLKRMAGWKPVHRFRHDTAGAAKRSLVYLLFVASIAVAMVFVELEATVSGEFTILPMHNADVRAQVEGIIERIEVEESDSVQKGQVIAMLAEFDKRAELIRIETDIRRTTADLKALKRGPTIENIAVAEHAVNTAKTNLAHTGKRFEQAKQMRTQHIERAKSGVAKAEERLRFDRKETARQEKLIQKEFSSEKTYDASLEAVAVGIRELEEANVDLRMALTRNLTEERQAIAVAEREVIDAQARLDVLLAGNSQEEIDATRAKLERLEVDKEYVQAQIDLLAIRSPIDGIVTTPRPTEKIGQLVEKGDLILEIHDYSTAIADIHLSEKDIGEVELGQEVALKARSFPSRSFVGSVSAIASTATNEDDGLRRNVIRISTRVPNLDLTLKPGMSGYGKVKLGKRRLYKIVSRRLIRFIRVEFWSWW